VPLVVKAQLVLKVNTVLLVKQVNKAILVLLVLKVNLV
jgi:hypothetical protein